MAESNIKRPHFVPLALPAAHLETTFSGGAATRRRRLRVRLLKAVLTRVLIRGGGGNMANSVEPERALVR